MPLTVGMLLGRRNMTLAQLAEKTGQSRQNMSNKISRGNFTEKELQTIAAAIKDLNNSGYTFKRSGGNHDIYYNPETKYSIPLKRGHFDEDDLRYIRKEIK